jgi:xanthine/CO dehydrogenase XdhC/CoxF family maturation factor
MNRPIEGSVDALRPLYADAGRCRSPAGTVLSEGDLAARPAGGITVADPCRRICHWRKICSRGRALRADIPPALRGGSCCSRGRPDSAHRIARRARRMRVAHRSRRREHRRLARADDQAGRRRRARHLSRSAHFQLFVAEVSHELQSAAESRDIAVQNVAGRDVTLLDL